MNQQNKQVLLRRHALIVLVAGLLFAIIEFSEKQFLLGAVLAVMILSLTLPILLVKERFCGSASIASLCIGTLFVVVVLECAKGDLHEMFPLYLACLTITGIYFDPKLIIKFGVVMNAVLIIPMLLFWRNVCVGAEFDMLIRSFLAMEISIFLVYITISWGSGFIEEAQKSEKESQALAEDIKLKADETAQLMQKQSAMLEKINDISNVVTSQSENMLVGSQSLAQSTLEQSSVIDGLRNSSSEIAQTVKASAKKASEANIFAESAGKKMMVCSNEMNQLIAAISEIKESSASIGKVIKTVEDIAFQTNILALNAAVEAARAGTAGKGFAVVADEVRNLASKSAEASKSTGSLIQNSISSVERGTAIAQKAADSLGALAGSMSELIDTIDQISASSSKQSDSIAAITSDLTQISQVVQSISATAEESAATSQELRSQAGLLKAQTNQF